MSDAPEPDQRLRTVQRLAVTSVVLTLLLMVLGAWVKANGAGLSCPDWPACYGQLLPPFPSYENGGTWTHVVDGQTVTEHVAYTQAQELYEWSHRAVVAMLVVPLGAWCVAVWQPLRRMRGTATPFTSAVRGLPWAALGLYVLQAGLGAVTVLVGNKPWATTAHLATATLFLTTQVVGASHAFLKPLGAPVTPPAPAAPKPQGFVWDEAQP